MDSNRAEFSELRDRIVEAVTMGAADWFSRAVGGRRPGGPICDDDRLENAIRICQMLMADLKTVLTVHDKIFMHIWQIPAFKIVYLHYDRQLTDLVKPVIDGITRALKSIQTSNAQIVVMALEASGEVIPKSAKHDIDNIAPRLSMGTSLFELYLCLQQFHKYKFSS